MPAPPARMMPLRVVMLISKYTEEYVDDEFAGVEVRD